jgi:hypothetical protein
MGASSIRRPAVVPASWPADAHHMPSARPHAGYVASGLGALLTLAALWMPWYAPASPKPAGAMGTLDAWSAFGGTDALLAGAAALVLVAAVAAAGDRVDTAAAARGIAAVGAASLGLVVLKLVDQPGPDALLDVRPGVWAAAAGGALMLAGGLAAARPLVEVSVSSSRTQPHPPGAGGGVRRGSAPPETRRNPGRVR